MRNFVKIDKEGKQAIIFTTALFGFIAVVMSCGNTDQQGHVTHKQLDIYEVRQLMAAEMSDKHCINQTHRYLIASNWEFKNCFDTWLNPDSKPCVKNDSFTESPYWGKQLEDYCHKKVLEGRKVNRRLVEDGREGSNHCRKGMGEAIAVLEYLDKRDKAVLDVSS